MRGKATQQDAPQAAGFGPKGPRVVIIGAGVRASLPARNCASEAGAISWFSKERRSWATGGCQSWYLDQTGTPAYDAVSLPQLQASLAAPVMDDFEVRALRAR